ncbi:ATP-dependent RNA helicase DbpA [Ahniella affigens]|uniref:ATP-dependent RNA helicase DbpA n=1 Tax=Ahniella affigens TaxID=2021234 RepID=A0A2P1PLV9_9GAMM|nr:ATP-dependent RNA helicase DbpA [Ahniella affigens]AVP95812.1 ATP-dependent RNA helicase DbpA [Ahniella affigens]
METFAELPLNPLLIENLTSIEHIRPTPVQAAALPLVLAGRDLIVQAETGSGKTAAFALGLLQALDVAAVKLQGLVLCPTRELADQVAREFRRLARPFPNVKVLTLCGGVPLRPHLASLVHEPHVVVGTPGRILELLEQKALPLKALKALVLDEADRMLDMGFQEDIEKIIQATPKQRQTLLFSATWPEPLRALAKQYLREPESITIDPTATATDIQQTFFEVTDPARKPAAVVDLLLARQPESVVVFCNTRADVRAMTEYLDRAGFSVLALHGELDQRDRDEMLLRFANRSCSILVATDVAARGLDIKDLPMVINADLATDVDTHIHRIGRTGRAGAQGHALTLFTGRESHRLEAIEARLGVPMNRQSLPRVEARARPWQSPFVTLAIDAGKTEKVRPGDLLGALTGSAGLPADAVGKIAVFPTRSYVAIARAHAELAFRQLKDGKIKGRSFRVRKIGH